MSIEPAAGVVLDRRPSSSTWPLLREADHLGVSVLADHHDDGLPAAGRPARGSASTACRSRSPSDGAVLLDEAVATFDCTLHEEVEAGDHIIVLLEVHEVGGGDGEHPLVFHRSGFAKLHRDDLDPARLDGRINGAEVDRAPARPAPRPGPATTRRTPRERQAHRRVADVPPSRGRARLGRRRHDRVVRLLPLRHGRRRGLRQAVLQRPGRTGRAVRGLRHLRRRVLRPTDRRPDLRPLRRPHRAQADAAADPGDHGRRHRAHRPAADLRPDRRLGADRARACCGCCRASASAASTAAPCCSPSSTPPPSAAASTAASPTSAYPAGWSSPPAPSRSPGCCPTRRSSPGAGAPAS